MKFLKSTINIAFVAILWGVTFEAVADEVWAAVGTFGFLTILGTKAVWKLHAE